jgi:hypothetical protein
MDHQHFVWDCCRLRRVRHKLALRWAKAGWRAPCAVGGTAWRLGARRPPAHLRGLKRTATQTLFFSLPSRPLYCAITAISTREPVANHLKWLKVQPRCRGRVQDPLSDGLEPQGRAKHGSAAREAKSARTGAQSVFLQVPTFQLHVHSQWRGWP